MTPFVKLHHGDCLDILPEIPSTSIDVVITDPPYPEISRSYGRWTVDEWWALVVEGVIPEIRRVLKPTGSAVFILQPNSEHVGQMRGWLWEFMAWVCREWNMVQDIWWWNICSPPTGVSTPRERGLTRESLKACVWCGSPKCHRDQEAVLIRESESNRLRRLSGRCEDKRVEHPSGQNFNELRTRKTAGERGGVTPFNVLPIANADSRSSAGAYGHGAGTPLKLADWWTRYICPAGGTVLDPFLGSGTMGIVAVQKGCNFIGIEANEEYFDIAKIRIEEIQNEARQLILGI